MTGETMGERRVSIAGVGLSDCGRVPDKTRLQLIHQASQAALADAGLTRDDVEGFGSVGTVLPPTDISEYLGLRPTWGDSTNVGGAAWEVMAQHAAFRRPAETAHGQHVDRQRRSASVRRALRTHPHLEVRDGGQASHARVRHYRRPTR